MELKVKTNYDSSISICTRLNMSAEDYNVMLDKECDEIIGRTDMFAKYQEQYGETAANDYRQQIKDALIFKHVIPFMYDAVYPNDASRVFEINEVKPLVYANVLGDTCFGSSWNDGEKAVFNDLLAKAIDTDEEALTNETVAVFNEIGRYDEHIDAVNRKKLESKGYVSMKDINIDYNSQVITSVSSVEEIEAYQKDHNATFSKDDMETLKYELDTQGSTNIVSMDVGYNGNFYKVCYPQTTGVLPEHMLIRDSVQNVKTPESRFASCYGRQMTDEFVAVDEDEHEIDNEYDDASISSVPTEAQVEMMALDEGYVSDNWRTTVDIIAKSDNKLTMSAYETLVQSVESELEGYQDEILSAIVKRDTADSTFDAVERLREEKGLNGDEPDIPAYEADELLDGISREEYMAQIEQEYNSAQEFYTNKCKEFFKEVAKMDNNLRKHNVVLPDSECTLLGKGDAINPDYKNYILNEFSGDHIIKTIENRFEFDKYMDSRVNKDLPWNKEWNDRYNNNIRECWEKVKDKDFGEQINFAQRVYDSSQQVDRRGESPHVDSDVINMLGDAWYEVGDNEPIVEVEVDADSFKNASAKGVDFSKGAIKSTEEVQREMAKPEPKKTVVKTKGNDGHMPNVTEEKKWHNTVENGVSGNPDYDFDEYD